MPEDIESLMTGTKSVNASLLKPLQVSGNHPPKTYTQSPTTMNQLDMLSADMAPGSPRFNSTTKSHESSKWRINDMLLSHPTILFLSCACRYICMVREKTKA